MSLDTPKKSEKPYSPEFQAFMQMVIGDFARKGVAGARHKIPKEQAEKMAAELIKLYSREDN